MESKKTTVKKSLGLLQYIPLAIEPNLKPLSIVDSLAPQYPRVPGLHNSAIKYSRLSYNILGFRGIIISP